MNRPVRSIEIFTMSALDLFVTAMGSFAILMMILFPYFHGELMEPVTTTPNNRLVCVWPTRLKDFEQFVKEVPDPLKRRELYRPNLQVQDDAWRNPGYDQQPDYPVVGVTGLQAFAFCEWLTKKERAAGIIGPDDTYTLLDNQEWSAAAGPGKYPWGSKWPPPKESGNFGDETWAKSLGHKRGSSLMQGYTDRHDTIAPVGQYKPNRFGLHDMAGNVMQWVFQDVPTVQQIYRLRGSTWQHFGERLESKHGLDADDYYHPDAGGFRVKLIIVPRAKPPK